MVLMGILLTILLNMLYTLRDFDGGLARHEEAFHENPNSVWICGANGFGNALCRQPERSLEMLERARRLSPHDPSMFLWLPGGAIAHFLAGRPQEAIRWTDDALRLNPRHLISLLLRAAAGEAVERDSLAREHVERMRAINPALDLKFAGQMLPFKYADDKEQKVVGSGGQRLLPFSAKALADTARTKGVCSVGVARTCRIASAPPIFGMHMSMTSGWHAGTTRQSW